MIPIQTNCRKYHFSTEELCLLGAMLEIPCLYGVSGKWMKKEDEMSKKNLRKRVAKLEEKGLIFAGLGGVLYINGELQKLFQRIKEASVLCRFFSHTSQGRQKLLLYKRNENQEEYLTFLESDGKGGWFLGEFDKQAFFDAWKPCQLPSSATTPCETSAFYEKQWYTILFYRRQGLVYEKILDIAWQEGDDHGELFQMAREQLHQILEDEA